MTNSLALFRARMDRNLLAEIAALKLRNAHTIFRRLVEDIESRGVAVLPSSLFMGRHIPALGVQARRTLVLDLPDVVRAADRAGIALVAFDTSLPPAPVLCLIEKLDSANGRVRGCTPEEGCGFGAQKAGG